MSDLGNKEIMSENIQRLMNEYGKERVDLSKDLDVPYTTVTDWINGKTYPRIDKIEAMAMYFHVQKSDLVEKHIENDTNESKGFRIPVLGRVAAGIPIEASEEIIDWEELPLSMRSKGDFFGLRIKGDSMEPRIEDGDTVIVRRQNDAEDGEIVIALVNGDDGVCKRLKKYADGIALVSLNPAYSPMYFSAAEQESKPVRIIGKVVELRGKF